MRQFLSLVLFSGLLAAGQILLAGFTQPGAEQVGKTSYYSDSLHGRKTASGEKYDKNDLTCAHRTYPFGTLLRVTRLDNNKSVVVRVNDRGPHREGYVVELSRKGAEAIDLVRDGVTRVSVTVVELPQQTAANAASAPTVVLTKKTDKKSAAAPVMYNQDPRPAGTTKGAAPVVKSTEIYRVGVSEIPKRGFGVQVATLYDSNNLLPELAKVEKLFPGKVLVCVENSDDPYAKPAYKLVLGPFPERGVAQVRQKEAAKKGYKGAFVVDFADMP